MTRIRDHPFYDPLVQYQGRDPSETARAYYLPKKIRCCKTRGAEVWGKSESISVCAVFHQQRLVQYFRVKHRIIAPLQNSPNFSLGPGTYINLNVSHTLGQSS